MFTLSSLDISIHSLHPFTADDSMLCKWTLDMLQYGHSSLFSHSAPSKMHVQNLNCPGLRTPSYNFPSLKLLDLKGFCTYFCVFLQNLAAPLGSLLLLTDLSNTIKRNCWVFLLSLALWLHSMWPNATATTFMEETIFTKWKPLYLALKRSKIMHYLILYTAKVYLANPEPEQARRKMCIFCSYADNT